MFTVTYCLLVLKQIFFMSDLFNTFHICFQPLTKVFRMVAVKHAYDFPEISWKKTSSRIKTVMRNQYYSAALPKIYGPGNQEFSEVLCRHCTPSTQVFCSVASSKSCTQRKAQRSHTFCCSAGGVVFITVPGLWLCCISTLFVLATFLISLTCVLVRKIFWKKASSCFLTPVLMAGGGSVSEGALADFD